MPYLALRRPEVTCVPWESRASSRELAKGRRVLAADPSACPARSEEETLGTRPERSEETL
jgi:hypothetical protein